jgi:AcrR family transcriptional regulator
MESGTAVLGRRERSKLDKRRRISEAAREVFNEFGYERANMREIAKRAGVATGTLFLYAPDKRNLLLWILNDDLDRVTHETFEVLETELARAGVVEQMMYIFEARYKYWGADPELSLHALSELIISRDVMATPATHLGNYVERRKQMIERFADVVRAQQIRGNIDPAADTDLIARMAMAIYNAAVRTWLRTTNPDLTSGLSDLRRMLTIALSGSVRTSGRDAVGRSN